jgi:hypothetical protein
VGQFILYLGLATQHIYFDMYYRPIIKYDTSNNDYITTNKNLQNRKLNHEIFILTQAMKLTLDINLTRDTYLQIYKMCITPVERRLRNVTTTHISYVTNTVQPVHFNSFIDICFIIPLFGIIIKL